MIYLFLQTLFWLVLAFLLGLILGWLLRGVICGPCSKDDDHSSSSDSSDDVSGAYAATGSASASTDEDMSTSAETASAIITDDMQPAGIDGPDGEADDLKRISGIGPVIQKTLNGLGIYHFTQIADFTEDNITWVDNYIDFPGRIKRENWVSQAADLAGGAQTEFASRYDKGEVGENNPNT